MKNSAENLNRYKKSLFQINRTPNLSHTGQIFLFKILGNSKRLFLFPGGIRCRQLDRLAPYHPERIGTGLAFSFEIL